MSKARVGVYGLGTMGSALALNLADKGFDVAVTNRETDWIEPFLTEAGELAGRLSASSTLEDFVHDIATPRLIILMIPSGAPVDVMIDRLGPLLAPDDILIDAGNADFHDTRRRTTRANGFHFVGMGVSGGEEGARHGASMMVGGGEHSWRQLAPVLEPIAAKFDGDPCVAHVGPDGAGHFVKTVHNGIEYADMQMIAEVYGLLRDGQGWDAQQIGALFEGWTNGKLASFLIETTARVLQTNDASSGAPMVDIIRDQAGQKGTGRWTVIEALKLGQSASAIEAAVGARAWSSAKSARLAAASQFPGTGTLEIGSATLESALFAGRVLAHLQGFEVLRAASDDYEWSIDLARVAEIWRAGCIIRSTLLDDLAPLLQQVPNRPVLLAEGMAELLSPAIPALREVVASAVAAGLPVPALSAGLAWFDTARQALGAANLIQAQRDAFGAHGFERIDRAGKHHGDWGEVDG